MRVVSFHFIHTPPRSAKWPTATARKLLFRGGGGNGGGGGGGGGALAPRTLACNHTTFALYLCVCGNQRPSTTGRVHLCASRRPKIAPLVAGCRPVPSPNGHRVLRNTKQPRKKEKKKREREREEKKKAAERKKSRKRTLNGAISLLRYKKEQRGPQMKRGGSNLNKSMPKRLRALFRRRNYTCVIKVAIRFLRPSGFSYPSPSTATPSAPPPLLHPGLNSDLLKR